MATPKTLIILLLFLGVISACPDGECRQLFFRADFTFGNRRLIKHVIESVNVSDFDNCELRCYHQPNCVSINFNVIRDSGGFHKCELNNATHRGHDNELENKDGYIYKGAESACDKEPCENEGTCQSGYTEKGYRCLCPPQWTSDHCEQDVNECENETNPCNKDAICNNTNGSYSCHCEQGFVGDGFTCTLIIPHPSAWFPFNDTYNTSEIGNRTTSGSKHGEVYLSLGPDGTQNGSYFFRGSPAGSINFTGINSKLDIGVSITILFWLYTYEENAKTTFLQYKGMKLVVNHTKLTLTFPGEPATSNGLTGILAEKGWKFVGVSYNKTTAEAKLWINGKIVKSVKPTVSLSSQLLTLGGNDFKGKITQLMLFNLTLTEEQIQGIRRRMRLPAMIFKSAIISNNSFYRAELASFLALVVGKIESKWKRCHSALANKWDPATFHSNCDKKKHTVTIIKRRTFIFGGYTDIPWESSKRETYGKTVKAFIFSLKNDKALPPFKCLAKDKENAIYKKSSFGPSFGRRACLSIGFRRDRARAEICNPYSVPIEVRNKANSRSVLGGTSGYITPENYEVFYLA